MASGFKEQVSGFSLALDPEQQEATYSRWLYE